jgi:hypothetical protein
LFLESQVRPFVQDPPRLPGNSAKYTIIDGVLHHLDPVSNVPTLTTSYCYTTAFLVLYLHEQGKIDLARNRCKLSIDMGSGLIAYTELLKSYDQLLGVTGTLSCMTAEQVTYMQLADHVMICNKDYSLSTLSSGMAHSGLNVIKTIMTDCILPQQQASATPLLWFMCNKDECHLKKHIYHKHISI